MKFFTVVQKKIYLIDMKKTSRHFFVHDIICKCQNGELARTLFLPLHSSQSSQFESVSTRISLLQAQSPFKNTLNGRLAAYSLPLSSTPDFTSSIVFISAIIVYFAVNRSAYGSYFMKSRANVHNCSCNRLLMGVEEIMLYLYRHIDSINFKFII